MSDEFGDKPIKDVLKNMFFENKKLATGRNTVRIEEAWASEMGEMIQKYTTKIYFSGGKLTVYLTSAPLRSELSMSKNQIISLLNEAIGEAIVEEISLR